MFTVKATYRTETRKFTFEADLFPTFEQLTSQLDRVFPYANPYYLFDIFFLPNSHAPNSRILIGKEAHNAERFRTYAMPYQGRSWPGATLKFVVKDKTSEQLAIADPANFLGNKHYADLESLAGTSTLVDTTDSSDVLQTPVPVPQASGSSLAEERQSQRAQIENSRRIILDRIRERTSNRTSVSPPWQLANVAGDDPATIGMSSTMPATLRDIFRTPDSTASSTDMHDVMNRLRERSSTLYSRPSTTALAPSQSSVENSPEAFKTLIDIAPSTDASLRSQVTSTQIVGSAPLAANPSRLQRLQSVLSSRTASRTNSAASKPAKYNSDTEDSVVFRRTPDATSESIPPPSLIGAMNAAGSSTFETDSVFMSDALRTFRRGLAFLQEGSVSPAATEVTLDSARTAVPIGDTVIVPTERTFEEASERVVDLGLDILRRAHDADGTKSGDHLASGPKFESMPSLHTASDSDSDAGPGSPPSSDDEIPYVRRPRSFGDKFAELRSRGRRADHGRTAAYEHSGRRPLPPRPPLPEVPRLATWRRLNSTHNVGATATQYSFLPPAADRPQEGIGSAVPSCSPNFSMPWNNATPSCWGACANTHARAASLASRSRSIGSISRDTSPCRWTSQPQYSTVPPVPVSTRIGWETPSEFRAQMPPSRPYTPTFSSSGYVTGLSPTLPPPPPMAFRSPNVPAAYPLFNTADSAGDASRISNEDLRRQIVEVRRELVALRADFDRAEAARQAGVADGEAAGVSLQDKGKERASDIAGYASVAFNTPGNGFGTQQTQVLAEKARQIRARLDQWTTSEVPVVTAEPMFNSWSAGYTCDNCMKPIEGTVYRCLDCDDFEFCAECISSPVVYGRHGFDHAFYPLPCGGDTTGFIAAKAKRQGIEHKGVVCNGCKKPMFGIRHRCLLCDDFDFCQKCISAVDVRSQHDMQHPFFPIETPWNWEGYRLAKDCYKATHPFQPVHSTITCDGCNSRIIGVRHKCLVCDNFDFCPTCIADPTKRFAHDLSHAFLPVPKPGDLDDLLAARIVPTEPDPPVIHENIICNNCRDIVIGTRSKCLDCADFDLCEHCVSQGAKNTHNVRHQFVELATPGRVIVHRVYEELQQPEQLPYVHNAQCNLCGSRIRGDRYKCLVCPDFDTCANCFPITTDEHPGHGFVKVADGDLIVDRNSTPRAQHTATCDECGAPITGTRYKCLHPDCPDYDLCDSCEALPIPVHPPKHPFAKLRTMDAYLPFLWDNMTRAQSDESVSNATVIPEEPRASATDRAGQDQDVEVSCSLTPEEPENEPFICRYQSPLIPPPSQLSRVPSIEYADFVQDIPPLIPATWTPPWSWSPTPPEPIVVPNILSEDSKPLSSGMNVVPPHVVAQPNEQNHVPVTPPETPLVDISDVPTITKELLPSPREDIFERPASIASLPVAPLETENVTSAPQLEVSDPEWHQFWPEVTNVLKHLLHPPSSVHEQPFDMPGTLVIPDERKASGSAEQEDTADDGDEQEVKTALESPLSGEALLARPLVADSAPEMVQLPRMFNHRLSDYLAVSSSSSISPQLPYSLRVTLVQTNNIPDGSPFPPGAEFVKSWRVRNAGEVPWPEETSLVFVAGERLAPHEGASNAVYVGAVAPGEEIEMTCGEMKAPETAGKYVGYWRLHDGRAYFGNSVWVDIVVVEIYEESSEESLAASSVIIPPAPSLIADTRTSAQVSLPASLATPSGPLSDDGSMDSSLSLIDVPSSPSLSSEDEIYEDSRAHIDASPPTQRNDNDFVVLYETSVSEDD